MSFVSIVTVWFGTYFDTYVVGVDFVECVTCLDKYYVIGNENAHNFAQCLLFLDYPLAARLRANFRKIDLSLNNSVNNIV